MGLIFRRRVRLGRSTTANVSGHGLSLSKRAGRVSVSSRGRATVRLARGLSFRIKL